MLARGGFPLLLASASLLALVVGSACGEAETPAPPPAAPAPAPEPPPPPPPTAPADEGTGTGTGTGGDEPAEEGAQEIPAERLGIRGPVQQGSVVFGNTDPGTKLRFRRRKIPVSEAGDFVLGFGPNDPKRMTLRATFPDGTKGYYVFKVEKRDFETEVIDGLPDDMVDLDKETKKELGKYRRIFGKIRNRTEKTPYFTSGFVWPVKGRISGRYGSPRVLNGEKKSRHWGVDVAAKTGKKVRAPADGKVVFAEKDVPLSGSMIILDHGHGLSSAFLHLSRISVKVGDEVKQGTVIGRVGKSGRATGAHLDWRMNVYATRVDPQLVTPTPEP